MSYGELAGKMRVPPRRMEHNSLTQAIPRKWKRILRTTRLEDPELYGDYKMIDQLLDEKKPIRFLYNKLVEEKCEEPTNALNRWIEDTNSELKIEEFIKEHVKQQKLIANNRLKSFNFNFMQRNIPYEVRLHKMKIKETPKVLICGHREDIMHLYWRCISIRRLWEHLKNLVQVHMKAYFIKDTEHCLLGTGELLSKKRKENIQHLCILTKHYIHLSKCSSSERNILGLELYIKTQMRIEKAISIEKGRQHLFTAKWGDLIMWIESNQL